MTLRNVTNIKREMLDYLPKYYEDIPVAENFINRESSEFISLNNAIKDVLDQFFVDTATWGIGRWESLTEGKYNANLDNTTFDTLEERKTTYSELDSTTWSQIETMYPPDLQRRRSNVKAKLRGSGTVTSAMIKNVAESFSNGEVEVIESPETYSITIKFVSSFGVPPNLGDIQNAIKSIIPAHLAVNFEFLFITYDQAEVSWTTYDAMTATMKTYDDILNGR